MGAFLSCAWFGLCVFEVFFRVRGRVWELSFRGCVSDCIVCTVSYGFFWFVGFFIIQMCSGFWRVLDLGKWVLAKRQAL